MSDHFQVVTPDKRASFWMSGSPDMPWAKRCSVVRRGRSATEAVKSLEPNPLAWLEEVYSLVSRGLTRRSMDVLFDNVERLLAKSEFDACDSVLRAVDVARLGVTTNVALLSITAPASAFLDYRPTLTARIRNFVVQQTDETRAAQLLNGLL